MTAFRRERNSTRKPYTAHITRTVTPKTIDRSPAPQEEEQEEVTHSSSSPSWSTEPNLKMTLGWVLRRPKGYTPRDPVSFFSPTWSRVSILHLLRPFSSHLTAPEKCVSLRPREILICGGRWLWIKSGE